MRTVFSRQVLDEAHRRENEFLEHVQPAVQRAARRAFGHLPPFRREELEVNAVGLAWQRFCRHIRDGGEILANVGAIALYAVRDASRNCSVAGQQHVQDAMSLPREVVNADSGIDYVETLLSGEDDIPEEVAVRLDFTTWRDSWDGLNQAIIDDLAVGFVHREVQARQRVSRGSLNSRRRKFFATWQQFQGEPV
jgi:hypothetical protein